MRLLDWSQIAVLEGVERNVDDVVDILHGAAGALRAGHDLFLQHADDLQPRVVDLDEFAEGGIVAEQIDFGAFAEDANRGAGGIVGFVEEAAFFEMEAVDDGIGGPDAVELRYFARQAWGVRARDAANGARRGFPDLRYWL